MHSRRTALAAALFAAATLCACSGHKPPQLDYDPWESMNRKVFALNEKLDKYALEPPARWWNRVVPNSAQRAISRFYNNLRFPINFVNDILQGKPRATAEELARFEINTFMGVFGLFDVAADWGGLPLQREDFGQTLGVWGFSTGPFLMLPFLGPSGVRDGIGLAGDYALGLYTYFIPFPYITIGTFVINVVNERSLNLELIANAREASLDFYTFQRNAYLQHRWRLINDSGTTATPEEQNELYNDQLYENYLEQGETP
jgi:phospholipid-binding lipoprotein MlaA